VTLFLQISCELIGKDIVSYVVNSLCGHNEGIQSALFPNMIETLLNIISGCEEVCPGRSPVGEWVLLALDTAPLQLIFSPSDKQLIMTAIFKFAVYDPRRFKALMMDVSKIALSQATVDSLLCYEM
jgi:hypothetical protein